MQQLAPSHSGCLRVFRQLWLFQLLMPQFFTSQRLLCRFPVPEQTRVVDASLQRAVINVFMEGLGTRQPFDDFLKEMNASAFILALTCKHRRKGGGPHSAHLT